MGVQVHPRHRRPAWGEGDAIITVSALVLWLQIKHGVPGRLTAEDLPNHRAERFGGRGSGTAAMSWQRVHAEDPPTSRIDCELNRWQGVNRILKPSGFTKEEALGI